MKSTMKSWLKINPTNEFTYEFIIEFTWFRQVPKTVTSPLLDSEMGAVSVGL